MPMDYYDYSSQIPDRKPVRLSNNAFHDEALLTSRSSESGSSRMSRVHGISFDVERRISHESKPRLSKDQQDILERHFQAQPKPSTLTKKDFSERLGVPLDKINNWFQNRRAKVKQDAKKQHSATMMQFAAQMAHAQYPGDSQYIDPSFYPVSMADVGHRPMMMPHGLQIQMPAEMMEPLVNGNVNHFGQGFEAAPTPFPQGGVEPTFNDSPDVFNTFFGLDDSFQTYTNNFNHHALVDFGKQFNPSSEPLDTYQAPIMPDSEAYSSSTSASVFTQSSHEESSLHLNHMSGEELSSSRLQRSGSRPIQATSYPNPGHHNLEQVIQAEPQYELEAANIPHDMFTFQDQAQLPFRHMGEGHGSMHAASYVDVKQQPMSSSDTSVTPQPAGQSLHHMQQHLKHAQSDFVPQPQQILPSPPDEKPRPTPVRADSVIDLHMETIKSEPSNDDGVTLKQPTTGLAARRRHRPAQLGTASMRSVSFTNNIPASPKNPVQDQNVRRIKSIGVMNGRVQKSGLGSAQRSPLGFTFPDGTVSPQLSRQMSVQSMNALAAESCQSNGDSVPMTPLSPMEIVQSPQLHHGQSYRTHGAIPESDHEPMDSTWTSVSGSSGMTGSGPFWAYTAPPAEYMPGYASPPRTPMDFVQHQHLQHPQFSHSPMPQSAPAWQPSFHPSPHNGSPYPNGMTMNQHVSPHGSPPMPQHMSQTFTEMNAPQYYHPSTAGQDAANMLARHRRPSIPMMNGGIPMGQLSSSAPIIHASAELPSGHSRQQYQQHQPPYMFPPPPPIPLSQEASPTTRMSSLPSKPSAELFIHEYSPREPADPSRLPPKVKTTTPKTFSFQHTGPEFFSSP